MTQQQVLEKAIEKAIAGGWHWQKIWSDRYFILPSFIESPVTYIYCHDFAKALWGHKEVYDHFGGNVEFYDFSGEDWQYHLMCMVISDDPIAYLEQNI